MWSNWWNKKWQGKVLRKNVPQCHFLRYKSHMIWFGMEPGPPFQVCTRLMAWYCTPLVNRRVFTCQSLINTKERIKLYITLLVIAPGISFCIYLVKPRRGCGKQRASRVNVAIVADFVLRFCILIKAKRPRSTNYTALSVFPIHLEVNELARGSVWLVSQGRGLTLCML